MMVFRINDKAPQKRLVDFAVPGHSEIPGSA